jgi:polyisoprenoid-binding protein YceI
MLVRKAALIAALALGSAALLPLSTQARSGSTTRAAADTYTIDPVHSSVIFRIKHLNTTNFYGQFNKVTGTIMFDESNPSACSIEAEIPVESIDTHNQKRDADVKGPDLFNASKFPTITFKSRSFSKAGDGYNAEGDLTLRGVTRPITIKLEKTGQGKGMRGGEILGLEATMDIKRSDFGMTAMEGMLGDDVRIIVSTESGKK